jgi:NADPH:quinone reductase-like Zn-dependent oxidoreductase
VRTFGAAPEVVALETYEPGQPAPGHVRVRMTARSVNPSDLLTISGTYSSRTRLPFVPGFEGMGVVEDVGPGVTELRVGDRVLPIGSVGSWQEVKIAPAVWCFPVAAELTDAQAAMSYINPLTAWLMLYERAALFPGISLVINAAGSAIGRILIRMANAAGIRPIALVRTDASRPLLAGLDLEAAVVAKDEAVESALREATNGQGVDLALDAVGGASGEALALSLRPEGHFLHYGLLSGRPLPADLPRRRPDVRFELFWLRHWVHTHSRNVIAARLAEVARLVSRGLAATPIEATYPLRNLTEALQHSLRRGRRGKILITS